MNAKLVITGTERDEIDQIHRRPSRSLVIPTHNLVLAALPQSDLNQIVTAAKAVELQAGDVIYENGDEIDSIYFPINSIFSAVAILEDGSTVEISMTGRDGIVGLEALIGDGRSIHWTRVSAGGVALRIPTPTLQDLFHQNAAISDATLRAYRRLFTQISQRSVCNVRHTLLQRLATWLLMVADRMNSQTLPFTQEQIANQISVRRAGVSVASSMLQSRNAISCHRGTIEILDRLAVEHAACECYEILGSEFAGAATLRRVSSRREKTGSLLNADLES
jgi:CRP-like cAMP-binding protein